MGASTRHAVLPSRGWRGPRLARREEKQRTFAKGEEVPDLHGEGSPADASLSARLSVCLISLTI